MREMEQNELHGDDGLLTDYFHLRSSWLINKQRKKNNKNKTKTKKNTDKT